MPQLRFVALLAALTPGSLLAATGMVIPLYGLLEIPFEARRNYRNPYVELHATADLIPPAGPTRTIPLFWDGGTTVRLRFSPDVLGSWKYSLRSNDPALDGRVGSFQCVRSALRGSLQLMPRYPRHFQYQNGEPCWWLGDTAWALFTDMPEERHDRDAALHYLRTRAEQGFTVVHSMLMSESGHGNPGGSPFEDLSREQINPAYWQEVDARLRYANELGLVVGLSLAWGDKKRQEPWAWSRFPDFEARRRYARYIAARYSAFQVYFIVSGEWHAEARTRQGITEEEIFQEFVAIGEALRTADPHGRLITIHPMSHHGSVREFADTSWMSFADYQQNYADLHQRALLSAMLNRPVINAEYGYLFRDADGDGQPDKDNSFSVDHMRHASWDIAMAGAYFITGFGRTYFGGYRDPGPFDIDAANAHPWIEQIRHMRRFFASLDWWRLIPADGLVRCGVPRGADQHVEVSAPGGRVRHILRPPPVAYWAMQIPGVLYVLYFRGLSLPLELSLDSRPGNFTAELFNPRSGQSEPLGRIAVSKQFRYTPRDSEDWVLVLRRLPTS